MHNFLFLFCQYVLSEMGPQERIKWPLLKGFDYLPHKLRLLRLDGYPMRCIPTNFRPENRANLEMQESKLEKLKMDSFKIRNIIVFCYNVKCYV